VVNKIEGLNLVMFLRPEGDSYIEGLTIDGQPLPIQWTQEDWNRLKVGSQIEIVDRFTGGSLWQSEYRISGVVHALDLEGINSPWIEMTATFEGHPEAFHPNLWGGNWGNFF
jgi:hypothetical protein